VSNYTKGPWETVEDESFVRQKDAMIRMYIASLVDIPNSSGGEASTRANARLIAAAPELLEACKEFVRKVECGQARSTASYQQMRAAIAKAESNV